MAQRKQFEEYITNNLDNAYRFAYTYTKNQQDAEDVVANSVLKALKSIDSLRKAEFIKTWFYRIIINTALDQKKRNQKIVYMDAEHLDNHDVVIDDYSDLNFQQMIEHLDEQYKTIIVLRFFENLKLGEIAEVLNISENTVKTRLYRALKMLKKDYEGEYNE